MKLKEITSGELPDIGRPVAECVNSGEWTLYRPSPASGETSDNFFLKMGPEVYVLDSRGKIVRIIGRDASPAMDEVFYFSDLPKPQSLSNGNLRLTFH